MDGQEMPKSFSYEELEEMGVLEFDDIYIRKSTESTWHIAKYYDFPEASSSSSYTIDQYGQIVRPKDSTNSTSSSDSSRPSSSYHGSSFDWDDAWDVIKTIFRFLIPIAILSISIASC